MGNKHVYIEYMDATAEIFSDVSISWMQQDQAIVVTHGDEYNGYSWIPYGIVKKVWVQDGPFEIEEDQDVSEV